MTSDGVTPNPPQSIVNLLREHGVPLAAEAREAYSNRNRSTHHQEEFEANLEPAPQKHPKEEKHIKPVVLLYHGFMMCSEVWLCNLDEERNLAFVLAEAG
jgi:hypothetical protein